LSAENVLQYLETIAEQLLYWAWNLDASKCICLSSLFYKLCTDGFC